MNTTKKTDRTHGPWTYTDLAHKTAGFPPSEYMCMLRPVTTDVQILPLAPGVDGTLKQSMELIDCYELRVEAHY